MSTITLYPLMRRFADDPERVDRITVRGFDNDANEREVVVVEIVDGRVEVALGPDVTVRTLGGRVV